MNVDYENNFDMTTMSSQNSQRKDDKTSTKDTKSTILSIEDMNVEEVAEVVLKSHGTDLSSSIGRCMLNKFPKDLTDVSTVVVTIERSNVLCFRQLQGRCLSFIVICANGTIHTPQRTVIV